MKTLLMLALLISNQVYARSVGNAYIANSNNVAVWSQLNLSSSNATTGTLPNARTTATSANTSDTIVLRDSSGNFSCGTITAALNGNATTATSLAANPTDCGVGTKAISIDASGNLTCSAVSLTADVSGTLPVGNGGTGATSFTANYVLLGNSTSSFQTVAPGANGNVLTSNGSTWISSAPGSISSATSSFDVNNVGFSSSVSANAFTLALKQADGSSDCSSGSSTCSISFRGSTATNGNYNQRTVTSSLSITIPSGTTLGTQSAVAEYIYVYAIDNSGTVELALSTNAFADGGSIVSTSAISGGSSRSTIYSTTARSNVPIRLIGRVLITEATAGTWASNATELSVFPFERSSIVSKSTVGVKIQFAVVSTTCNTATCTIASGNESSWLSSISRVSAGVYTANFTTGFWTTAPSCFTWFWEVNRSPQSANSTSITTTTYKFQQSASTDDKFNIMCIGY